MKESLNGKTVLIVGGGKYSGGREAALAHKYSQSPQVEKVYVWPGNDLIWINCDTPVHSFPGESVTDTNRITQAVKDFKIDLVDVTSDEPLAAGVVDTLIKRKITTFGAASGVARLEFDKYFSRREQERIGLPIPKYHFERKPIQDSLHRALDGWYQEMDYTSDSPSVIKANGLADGKGVYVADTLEEAHFGLDYVIGLPKGWQSGILFEEKVGGPNAKEWSDFYLIGYGPDTRAVSSSYRLTQWYNMIGVAQDHKRLGEGDTGLNTGGMGAVSWPMFVQEMYKRLWDEGYSKIINGFKKYTSSLILYSSWMYDPDVDKFWLIEFNTRHGDPEAQVILPGIENDYFDLTYSAARNLSSKDAKVHQKRTSRISAAVVTDGYPGDYSVNLGQPIHRILDVIESGRVKVYGAGARQVGSRILTGAGRNLHLVAEAQNVFQAHQTLVEELERLGGPIRFRRDIGYKEEQYIDENYEKLMDLGAIFLKSEEV